MNSLDKTIQNKYYSDKVNHTIKLEFINQYNFFNKNNILENFPSYRYLLKALCLKSFLSNDDVIINEDE